VAKTADSLDWPALMARLRDWRAGKAWRLDLLECGGSSNDILLMSPQRFEGEAICLLHAQTAGRGTRGRQWLSRPGGSLTFSVSRPLPVSGSPLGLSLAVGAVLAETFSRLGLGSVALKWPNDLLYDGRKLGGVLVETRYGAGHCLTVVGVGLNLFPGPVVPGRSVAALCEIQRMDGERLTAVCALLLRRVAWLLRQWPAGRDYWLRRWQEHDGLLGRPIRLTRRDDADTGVEGIATGIDRDGRLQIQTRDGLLSIAAGGVTVRFED